MNDATTAINDAWKEYSRLEREAVWKLGDEVNMIPTTKQDLFKISPELKEAHDRYKLLLALYKA